MRGKMIRIAPKDNVAVALAPVSRGDVIFSSGGNAENLTGIRDAEDMAGIRAAEDTAGIRAAEDIPQGHKAAIADIPAGAQVIKYGTPIGHALRDIAAGEWVHTHNMATNLSGRMEYRYEPDLDPSWAEWTGRFLKGAEDAGARLDGDAGPGGNFGARPDGDAGPGGNFGVRSGGDVPAECLTFSGYRRPDGKVGIRNEIWIIPTVGCVNDVAGRLAAEAGDPGKLGNPDNSGHPGNSDNPGHPGDPRNPPGAQYPGIDGVYAFSHPYGCSQTGDDHARTKKLLAALARHPNAGGVLVVSLGCENCTHEQFTEELGDYDPARVKFLICQQEQDEIAAGRELLRQLMEHASRFVREEIPVSELIVGMKCGGSDGLSGITANPLVGSFGDMLIRQGGSAVLTEVPEMFGAEEMLLGRSVNGEVFAKACGMLNGFKDYFLSHGEAVYENPSPGNKAGGITTLEDKSCGCVQKGGTAPVTDVIGYGGAVTKRGLTLLSGPGNDLVSATALAAAGAHLILFTTGRGTPFGAPVPTIKISTNTALAERKPGWIDFNAGVIADRAGEERAEKTGGEGEAGDMSAPDRASVGTEGTENSCGDPIRTAAGELMELVLMTASGRWTKSEENGYRGIAVWKDGVTL